MTPALPWLAESLARALAAQRAHATLVHGPAGVGQFEFAHALAAGWLCEAAGEGTGRPCGVCAGCRLFAARAHPDFLLLIPDALREALGWQPQADAAGEGDGKRKAKPSREIRVDAVRAAIDWGQKTASRGRAKVVLLHPADALNPVAANALLKTLEEPPGALRLLLTSADPAALLPTVRSRCQRISLGVPPADQALAWLQAQGVEGAPVLLAAAGGQPLEAQAMAADGLSAALWRDLPRLVHAGYAAPLIGLPLPCLIDALQRLAHDLALARVGQAPRFLAAPPPAAERIDAEALAHWAAELVRARRHDEHPWNAGLLAEALVAGGRKAWQIAASGARPSPTLAAR
jgi:DNA polymerase-3 subunit delta'